MEDFNTVIRFWFEEITPDKWWKKDLSFDEEIRRRFLPLHQKAKNCELDGWRSHAKGALAEIIILDQFSRNMFRGQPESFLSDPMALCLAQTAINRGFDRQLLATERPFIYMPFMHSESKEIHKRALALFEQPELSHYLEYELQHKQIIDRFGRYPHRNTIISRTSTPEELQFLKEA